MRTKTDQRGRLSDSKRLLVHAAIAKLAKGILEIVYRKSINP